MTEEKEEPKEEPIVEEPVEKNSTEMIDRANAAAQRLEEANKKQEALLHRQEALQVEKTLGGQADAGTAEVEETPAEYTKRVMANEAETKNP